MYRCHIYLICLISSIWIYSVVNLNAQRGYFNTNLKELPIILSWNDDGILITAKPTFNSTTNWLEMKPSRYIEQISKELIRIVPNTDNAPAVIDFTEYKSLDGVHEFNSDSDSDSDSELVGKVRVHMPKLTLSEFDESHNFIVEIINYSNSRDISRQRFLFKGLDVFHVGTDECVKLSANQNKIVINVEGCDIKHLVLRGGSFDLIDIDTKIPDLCRKYNDFYYSDDQVDAFVCLEDCRRDDPNAKENIKHSRQLMTKYNIIDFEDFPLSFLGNMLLTKKGVGLNLKVSDGRKGKKTTYSAYDEFRFFPWYEFINLQFNRYVDENQLQITDPYENSYIYNSKVHFSNVELIRFFSELKSLIADHVN